MLVGERGVSPVSAPTQPMPALKRLIHLLLLQFWFRYADLQFHPALEYWLLYKKQNSFLPKDIESNVLNSQVPFLTVENSLCMQFVGI